MPTEQGREWPLTLIRRGERIGSERPDYVWWQEVPADTTAEAASSVGYEVIDMVPASQLEAERAKLAGLVEAMSECIDLAEEGWAYASDYFREKWEFEKEIAKARAALSKATEGPTDSPCEGQEGSK